MPQSLAEYAQWLSDRNLRWPSPPKLQRVKAEPHCDPLPGVKAVLWNVYGTLLRISDGELLHDPHDAARLEVALDKTIREFNMWHSMTRKPGAPWEYMMSIYRRIVEELRMVGTRRKGDVPEVNSAVVWRRIVGRLAQKEYEFDRVQYGDEDALSEKIAYFFHEMLQGHEAAPDAAAALNFVVNAGLPQGLLADAQCFTLTQLVRDLQQQDSSATIARLFRPELVTLSYVEGVRKPSMSLFAGAYRGLKTLGLAPEDVLYVSSRVAGDLAVAKAIGFRTAVYAGEKLGLSVTVEDLQNPDVCPDRLLTSLSQIRDVLTGSQTSP
jgi:FMN phosphatase YigB (HAD superfamily)